MLDVANRYRVGIIPNRSLIRGKVVAIRPEPGGYGHTIEMEVSDSESLDDLPNFTHHIMGQRVLFYLSESDLELHPGDQIEAKATYRGGANSGRYSLLPDDIKRI